MKIPLRAFFVRALVLHATAPRVSVLVEGLLESAHWRGQHAQCSSAETWASSESS